MNLKFGRPILKNIIIQISIFIQNPDWKFKKVFDNQILNLTIRSRPSTSRALFTAPTVWTRNSQLSLRDQS